VLGAGKEATANRQLRRAWATAKGTANRNGAENESQAKAPFKIEHMRT